MLFVFARQWPDSLDLGIILLYFTAVVLIPTIGYWLMVADMRAYYRALKGVLVRVVFHFPALPAWARHETPSYLKALGLSLPCTEQQVKNAYLQLAEQLHPDRGGDRQQFLQLQRQFEQSLQFLRHHEPEVQGPSHTDT